MPSMIVTSSVSDCQGKERERKKKSHLDKRHEIVRDKIISGLMSQENLLVHIFEHQRKDAHCALGCSGAPSHSEAR